MAKDPAESPADTPLFDEDAVELRTAVADEDAGDVAAGDETAPEKPAEKPAEEEVVGIRDIAGEFGLDLSGYEDDVAAMRHLAEQAKAAKQQSELAAYGQEFVKHAADGSWQKYQEWKDEQARAAQAAEPKLWDPPEWNPSWSTLLKQDDSGNIVPDVARGGTAEHVAKFQRYLAFRQEQQDRFWTDPFKFIEPYVTGAAEKRARELIEEKLSEFGSELDARHFVLANDWLWEDKQKRVLSDDGKFFAGRFKEIDEDPDFKGLTQKGKEKLALQSLDHYRQQKTQAAAQTPEEKRAATLKAAAGYTPSSGGSETRKTQDGAPIAQNDNATFAEMLRAEFSQAGYEPTQELVEV